MLPLTPPASARLVILLTLVLAAGVSTAQAGPKDLDLSSPPPLPAKSKTVRKPANQCSQYGAGFMQVPGSDTCMRIGGAIGVGVGTSLSSSPRH